MFGLEKYLNDLLTSLNNKFEKRLLYVGLQGSYLRNEANVNSDIDIMVIIDEMTIHDLDDYKKILISIGYFEKSCGFICGKSEMANWNPLEVCQLLYTTKDLYGKLADLVPTYTVEDEKNFIKLSLGNLFMNYVIGIFTPIAKKTFLGYHLLINQCFLSFKICII